MNWILVGRVTRTHGLKGELKFYPSEQNDVTVQSGQRICLGEMQLKIESVRGV